jgi:hypothetical protein
MFVSGVLVAISLTATLVGVGLDRWLGPHPLFSLVGIAIAICGALGLLAWITKVENDRS